MKIKRFKFQKDDFFAFLLAIVPILSLYMIGLPFVSAGETVMILLCVPLVLSRRKNVILNKNMLVAFFGYEVFASILLYVFHSSYVDASTFKEAAATMVYIVSFFVIATHVNIHKFIKYYVIIAYIASLFLIFQFVFHLQTGIWIPGIIPGLESSFGRGTNEIIATIKRATSFFKEPAHFAQYVSIPYVLLLTQKDKTKKEWIKLTVMIIALILTLSGNALLILGIGMFCFFISRGKRKAIFYLLFGSLFVGAFVFYLVQTNEVAAKLFMRVYEIAGNEHAIKTGNYSGYIRILRGYLVYNEFGFFEKIYGTGIGVYPLYSLENCYDVLTSKISIELDYLNGIQYYLASTGIIGLLLYLVSLMGAFKRQVTQRKYLLLMFLGLMMISAIYREPIWLMFMIIFFVKEVETDEY